MVRNFYPRGIVESTVIMHGWILSYIGLYVKLLFKEHVTNNNIIGQYRSMATSVIKLEFLWLLAMGIS